MAAIELTGRINEKGNLEIQLPNGLPPGPVHVTIMPIDPNQAWYWTAEWQEGEKEADQDIAEGRVQTFDSMEDMLDDLMSDE